MSPETPNSTIDSQQDTPSEPPPPTAAAGAEQPAAGDTAAPAPPAGEPTAPGAGDEWDEEDSILTWKLLVAVAVVLGVVFVGAFLLFSNKKKDSTTTTGQGPATTQAADAPAIRDAFDRPDLDSLGKTSTGEDWQAVVGKFGIKDKQAYVVEKNKGPRNVAVIDTGSGDGSVSAKAAKLVDGWGLAFRFRGPNAYWYVQWNDQYKAFHVFKMQDGQAKEALQGGVPVPNSKDGMTVKVEFSGPTITVFVDGKPLKTLTDPYLKDQTRVGLFASEKGADLARWAAFGAQKELTGPPLTAAPNPKDKATDNGAKATPSSTAKPPAKAAGGGAQGATTTTKA